MKSIHPSGGFVCRDHRQDFKEELLQIFVQNLLRDGNAVLSALKQSLIDS